MYINCKSWFSLRYGTYSIEDLVGTAKKQGIQQLALTDINSTSHTWDFVDACQQQQIKPIAGAEIQNQRQHLYILLARNGSGFLAINQFITKHLQRQQSFPVRPVFTDDVFIIYPWDTIGVAELQANEFIGVQYTELHLLYKTDITTYGNRLVMRHPVTFQDSNHYYLHCLLRAINANVVISKLQQQDVAGKHETFLAPEELGILYQQHQQLIHNANALLDACSIELDFKQDKTRQVYNNNRSADKQLLEKLALEGLANRYGKDHEAATERVYKELEIIDKQGFNAYFLITWDIIQFARRRHFFFVGRGSGANSIVAFCLGITDVDPLELDLYFERFLNPARKVPPDFDIDFSWADRDEIFQYVFERYGSDHVSLLGAYTTFQKKAAIRELGKVFGLPKSEIDAIERLGYAAKEDAIHRKINYYASLMQDFPNHLSIHAGGILISDAPIHTYTVTELPPKGFATSQVDMFVAEKIGLFKLDLLSQRGLGHIKDAVELIRQNKGARIDIHDIEKFKHDKQVAERMRTADTIGCFYVESPGMRQLLQKLECRDYITLVAASSIIRPGVAQSGMMRQYIYRYRRPDQFEYLHPILKELLHETFGIMVYQEDVMKVAHYFAGLDMADADILRRAMNGKYRGQKHFEDIRNRFFLNCRQLGHNDQIALEVWRQMESFAGFSFSKAHSASFAVESYQSLYLKTYYPAEFMVAVINNFGGFYSRELYFHELKRTGVKVLPPCVNEGQELTSISGNIVHVGFIHVEGLEDAVLKTVLEERSRHGSYLHLQDFIERTHIPLEQLNLLIRTGALGFTGKNKKELLWEANFLQKKNARHVPAFHSLFDEPPMEFKLPQLHQHPHDDALDELELLGFPLGNVWPLADADLSKYCTAKDLPALKGSNVSTIGYFVTDKHARTIKKESMYFGTFLDKKGEWLDTVHFPQSFTPHLSPFQGKGFYELQGKVTEEFGVYSIEVTRCSKIGLKTSSGSPVAYSAR